VFYCIDDEADNASINTKDRRGKTVSETDVTAINGRIRELLDAFEKSAYVGYTATPFANIFINPDAETPKHGEDLFPRSFILNVSPPSNYVSPSRVFGLDGDPDSGIDPQQGLPLIRMVDDHSDVFPPKHKKELSVAELPSSLKHAVCTFVIACAARRARGQTTVQVLSVKFRTFFEHPRWMRWASRDGRREDEPAGRVRPEPGPRSGDRNTRSPLPNHRYTATFNASSGSRSRFMSKYRRVPQRVPAT
jgi:hypothetical protein